MRNLFVSAFGASLLVVLLSSACSSAGKTACADGSACGTTGKVQSCAVSDSSGACASGYYRAPDGKTFNWASCNDSNQAAIDVAAYCSGGTGDSGGLTDSAPPGTDSAPPDNDAGDDAAPE
jgi:hypothetical protein